MTSDTRNMSDVEICVHTATAAHILSEAAQEGAAALARERGPEDLLAVQCDARVIDAMVAAMSLAAAGVLRAARLLAEETR